MNVIIKKNTYRYITRNVCYIMSHKINVKLTSNVKCKSKYTVAYLNLRLK